MQSLVEMINQFDTGFSGRVKGVGDDTIEDFAELAGPLPGVYCRFLRTLGGDLAGFHPLNAAFDLNDRFMNYRMNPALRDSPLLMIAAGKGLAPGGSIYLHREKPYADDDCLLVVLPSGESVEPDQAKPLHAGLEECLFVEAYLQYRIQHLKGPVKLVTRKVRQTEPSTFALALDVCHKLQFERVSPCERSALFERDDAAIVIYRHPRVEVMSIQIGANENEELFRISDVLSSQLELRRIA